MKLAGNRKNYLKLLNSQEISVVSQKKKLKMVQENFSELEESFEGNVSILKVENKKIYCEDRKLVFVPKSKMIEIKIDYKKRKSGIKRFLKD